MDYNILTADLEKHPPKLLLVQWWDHATTNITGWQTAQSILELEPFLMSSVGWLFKETKGYILLVPTLSKTDSGGLSNICILKSDIYQRWDLNDPSTPRKRKTNRKTSR